MNIMNVYFIYFLIRYEEQVREQQSQLEKEDFSDMVAEHAAKQKVRKKHWVLLLKNQKIQVHPCNISWECEKKIEYN